ncbi:MAG: exodeoxyribonuclease VII large subunit [Bacteroidales bacterium]|nr:exodeoxyribonuclease VII large subunit [Bacteroidales bacterium]
MKDESDILDLYELTSKIGECVSEGLPENYRVKAEIASLGVKNGHCYLELSQNDPLGGTIAKCRATIWAGKYAVISKKFREATGDNLKAGIEILATVQVSFSPLYSFSLNILDIDPQTTLGALELQKKKTWERLVKEGLAERQKSLEVKDLPYHLAVISAESAAGFGDFCHHLDENEFGFKFEITLFEASMQGENSPASIASALSKISDEDYDLVLILRGGGGVLDLSSYDDYNLCKSIALCPVPVFTAIGHERDHHLCDDVAFSAVKTPTALADELISIYAAEDASIESFEERLKRAFILKISKMENDISVLESRIHSADPRNILSRGYILATDAKGKIVRKAGEVHKGDKLNILFSDGKITTKVE